MYKIPMLKQLENSRNTESVRQKLVQDRKNSTEKPIFRTKKARSKRTQDQRQVTQGQNAAPPPPLLLKVHSPECLWCAGPPPCSSGTRILTLRLIICWLDLLFFCACVRVCVF